MTKYNFLARLCFRLTKPKNEIRMLPFITVSKDKHTGYLPPFNLITLSRVDTELKDEDDGYIGVLNHEIDHWAQFAFLTPKEAVRTLQNYAFEREIYIISIGLGCDPEEDRIPFLERINCFRDVSPTWKKRNL